MARQAEKLQNAEYEHIVQEWIHPSEAAPKGVTPAIPTHPNPTGQPAALLHRRQSQPTAGIRPL